MEKEARVSLIGSSDQGSSERRTGQHYGKWRITVSFGALFATLVLATNIGVLAWVKSSFELENGVATVFEGSCQTSERATIGADLAINILGTLLLGASNHNAQLLSAPTRRDVDKAHNRAIWLDIGVSSVRNLRYVPRWRTLIWTFLLLSSIPLHLLYNSVVFATRSANDYEAALVTEDFINGAFWNHTIANIMKADLSLLQGLQQNVANLTKLDNKQCLQAYATSMYETSWSNVLIVTNLTSNYSNLLGVYSHKAAGDIVDLSWACDGPGPNNYGEPSEASGQLAVPSCDVGKLLDKADSWRIPVPACANQELDSYNDPYSGTVIGTSMNLVNGSGVCETQYSARVQYCLAEPFPNHCSVHISTRLLIAVIICNLIKIACMSTTILARAFRPLATIGDAIASFLQEPDPTTANKGALEVANVTTGLWTKLDRYAPLPWTKHRRAWWSAVARPNLNLCFLLCFIAWAGSLALLIESLMNNTANSISNFTAYTNNVISSTEGTGLVANVLLANTPQLLLSVIYVLYNDVFTRMLMVHEYSKFASHRKALRVTSPRGQQRSTFWLQLPYRYVLPMMTAMALLHWLISRSIFLVRLRIFNTQGEEAVDRAVDACGFSPLAILLVLCLSGIMILTLVGLGRFCKFDPQMPIANSCSVAISAAAHPSPLDHPDMATLSLQYGVVAGTAVQSVQYGMARGALRNPGMGWKEHVGFSSREVAPLESGVVYY